MNIKNPSFYEKIQLFRTFYFSKHLLKIKIHSLK